MVSAGTRNKPRSGRAESSGDAGDPAAGSREAGPNRLLRNIVYRGGAFLMQRGANRGLFGGKLGLAQAMNAAKRQPLAQTLVQGAILRVATRSVPGAILVGGGLLAKALHDRRKASKTGRQPTAQPTAQGPARQDDGEEA